MAPHIPATPTQAMCMMIGDRAAAIALKGRFAKDQVQVSQARGGAKHQHTNAGRTCRSALRPRQSMTTFALVWVHAKLG